MNMIFSIINIASPLLIITAGALASEWAGRMALFLDGIICLASFFCYAFTCLTGSAFTGCLLSVILCTLLVFTSEQLAVKLKADMFLTSLALNLLFPALGTMCGFYLFGTRGVLYSEAFNFNLDCVNTVTTIICIFISLAFAFSALFTKGGLALRICGSSGDVLDAQGLDSHFYKTMSWIIAASFASFAGCVYTLRLNSYVPGVAGGRGWLALAAVFLGRKNLFTTAVCVTVFAFAEYASASLQNIPLFKDISNAFLLSLPYILSLVLILVTPARKE